MKKKLLSMALSLIMIASLCSPSLAVDDSISNDESTGYVLDESFGNWNFSSRTSLHTVMFTVDGNGTLHVYNRYSNADHIYTYSSLSSYGSNLPDRFIVGYVIYKDSRSI